MMDSREVSLIVHLLLSLQMCHSHSAPVPAAFALEMLGRTEHPHPVGTWYVFNVEMECNYLCSRLELGGVAVVWTKRQPVQSSGTTRRAQFIIANPIRTSITMLGAFLPLLQPLPFLFRQHISPRALFMQPRPCTPSILSKERRRPTPT